jgi:hypothetical protein
MHRTEERRLRNDRFVVSVSLSRLHSVINRRVISAESKQPIGSASRRDKLNYELLWFAFRRLNRGKVPGVDGRTVGDHESRLGPSEVWRHQP